MLSRWMLKRVGVARSGAGRDWPRRTAAASRCRRAPLCRSTRNPLPCSGRYADRWARSAGSRRRRGSAASGPRRPGGAGRDARRAPWPASRSAGRWSRCPRRRRPACSAAPLCGCSLRVTPCLVFELDVEQRGHQVVGRVLRAPLDVVGVDAAVGDLVGLGHLHRRARLGAQVGVVGVADRRSGRTPGCRAACRSRASASSTASSAMMSKPSEPTSGSRQRTQILRGSGPRSRPSGAA